MTKSDNFSTYTTKAKKYARYRWDYATQAIEAMFSISSLTNNACVVDIGAGTGIFTRHFIGRVGKLYAIEPNNAMRQEGQSSAASAIKFLASSAENTMLPAHSVDLITVAQAIHWFNPEPARREFLRILKPGGWLAILRNSSQDDDVSRELESIFTPEYGVDMSKASSPIHQAPASHYFGSGSYLKRIFPFCLEQDRETYLGALCSTSFIPDETHPLYAKFEDAALNIFNHYHPGGVRLILGETELLIGQPA